MTRIFVGTAVVIAVAALAFLSPFEYIVSVVINILGLNDNLDQLNAVEAANMRLEVALFVGNLSVTAIAGAVVYILVTGAQAENTRNTLNIERLNTLHFLEKDIEEIFHEKTVLQKSSDNTGRQYIEYMSMFRYDWQEPSSKKPQLVEHQRMYDIGQNGELVASRSLHKSLNWFRRLERAYRTNVVKSSDIAALWRQVIPFTIQNRYTVMCCLFSKEDVGPIRNIGILAWKEICDSDREESVKEIFDQLDPAFRNELPAEYKDWIRRCLNRR